jgi:hypothetical protein
MLRLKSYLYAILAFLAATSVSVGPGGAVLLRLPPLDTLISHIDLYASGLLACIEVFSRLVPTEANGSLLTFLARLADSLLPNRAHEGGRFETLSLHNGPTV